MNVNLKAELLERSNNGLAFFKIYFGSKLHWTTNKRSRNLKNPFYKDKNGSFSIYEDDNGRWQFIDYGDPEFHGDCFNFYALVYNIDIKTGFPELLLKMKQVLEEGVSIIAKELPDKNHFQAIEIVKVDINEIEMSDEANKFWQDYGITKNVLKTNHVVQMNGYTLTYEDGSTKYIWQSDMTFAYKMSGYYKTYRPRADRKYKFGYLGKNKQEYVFGWHYQTESKLLFLTGGEKDVMTLHSLGFQAICLGSEVAKVSRGLLKHLYYDDYTVIILYDLDETGRREASKLSQKHSWRIADLSSIIDKEFENVKDVSDYIKKGLSISRLKAFLGQFYDEGLENPQIDEVEEMNEMQDFIEKSDENSYYPIPQTVYDALPTLFKRILEPFKNEVQKDLILIASLGVLSNFIEIKGVYRRKVVYPNLFIFITAPAASGKGIMSWAGKLGNTIQQRYNQQYKRAKEDFESNNRKGEQPKRKNVFLSANASVSAFIRQLFKNNGKGTIFETEADSLNGVMKNEDWGSFSDVLRRAFEFEKISMLRVSEDDSVEIEDPRLSIILSGTKNQLFKLIPSAENGLYSRFLFMDFPRSRGFDIDDDDDNNESLDEYFNAVSQDVYDYSQRSNGKTKFIITSMQKQEIKRHYSSIQDQFELLYGVDIVPSIRRIANIHFRISMLLAAVRMFDDDTLTEELICKDVDFEIGKDLVLWFLRHTVKIFQQLPNKPKPYYNLKLNVQKFYDGLQDDFTYQDALKIGETLNIPNGTVQKYLAQLKKVKLILAEAHGKYSKIKGTN